MKLKRTKRLCRLFWATRYVVATCKRLFERFVVLINLNLNLKSVEHFASFAMKNRRLQLF